MKCKKCGYYLSTEYCIRCDNTFYNEKHKPKKCQHKDVRKIITYYCLDCESTILEENHEVVVLENDKRLWSFELVDDGNYGHFNIYEHEVD